MSTGLRAGSRNARGVDAALVNAAVQGLPADGSACATAGVGAAAVAGTTRVLRLVRTAFITVRARCLRQLRNARALFLALVLTFPLGIVVFFLVAVLLFLALLLAGLGLDVVGAKQRRGAEPRQDGSESGLEQTPARRTRSGESRQSVKCRIVHGILHFRRRIPAAGNAARNYAPSSALSSDPASSTSRSCETHRAGSGSWKRSMVSALTDFYDYGNSLNQANAQTD